MYIYIYDMYIYIFNVYRDVHPGNFMFFPHVLFCSHLFPFLYLSQKIAIEDLEAVIAQGWALAKCQGHSMAFALLAVDRVETRCLEGFKMIDGFQRYAKP